MKLQLKEADTSFGTLGTAFISVLSLAIQNLSLTLQQFQWA